MTRTWAGGRRGRRAALVLALAGAAGCTRELGAELDHQPPVVSLSGLTRLVHGEQGVYRATAIAREGAIRSLTFEVFLGAVDRLRRVVTKDTELTHVFDRTGLHYVTVTATDTAWATGRATLPVEVVKAPGDDLDPPVVQLRLARGGSPLADGAGVSFGDHLTAQVSASDVDTAIGELRLEVRDATGAAVTVAPAPTFKPAQPAQTAEHGFTITVPEVVGTLRVQAVAIDTAAPPNGSPPARATLQVSAKDSDGDGLADDQETGACADPLRYNGLRLEVWPLAPFPKALCYLAPRPNGEAVLQLVGSSPAAFSTRVASGFLTLDKTGPIGGAVPGLSSAPAAVAALASGFALRYSGELCVPSGATTLELEAPTADDVLLLLVDGTVLAANPVGPLCTSCFDWADFSYIGSKAELDVTGKSSVGLEIVVANDSGGYLWSPTFAFFDATGAAVGAPLDQRSFLAP